MEINGTYKIYQATTKTGATREVRRPTGNGEAAVSGSGRDVIAISPEASFQARLQEASKQYAAKLEGEMTLSPQRLDDLQKKYCGEQCPVSGEQVAQAMLQSFGMPL